MSTNLRIMKSDFSYDLLIIGGGISACVFASKYLQNNVSKQIAIVEIGRKLGGRSSTRISKRFKGWKLNHGAPNFNISNSKNNLLLKNYINELLENKFIKIDDSELIFLADESKYENIIWMDADFQHPPKYIEKFIELSDTNDAIICSRFLNNSERYFNNPELNKDINENQSYFYNKLCKLFLYKDITDYTSGFVSIKKKRPKTVKEIVDLNNYVRLKILEKVYKSDYD